MQIVIPMKSIFWGKSRLSPILSNQERCEINKKILQRTICKAIEVANVFVVSSCQDTCDLAKKCGALPIKEQGQGLNTALHQVTEIFHKKNQFEILILPSDLPLFESEDLKIFSPTEEMILVPDHSGSGTNSLYLCSKKRFNYSFGTNSRYLHIEEAQLNQMTFKILQHDRLCFDLDTPEDYEALKYRL